MTTAMVPSNRAYSAAVAARVERSRSVSWPTSNVADAQVKREGERYRKGLSFLMLGGGLWKQS